MHNNNGHLVASVFVEDDKKYRHDDNGSEQYESVAYRLKEAIANATCLAIVLKWSVDATAESKQINRQTMKKRNKNSTLASLPLHCHMDLRISLKSLNLAINLGLTPTKSTVSGSSKMPCSPLVLITCHLLDFS